MIFGGMFAMKNLIKVALWAVLIIGICAAILWGINSVYQRGWTGGNDAAEAKWEKKHAAAMELKAKRIVKLQKDAEKKEKEFKAEADRHNEIRVEDKENAERSKDMAIAAVLDGTFKLRDPNSTWNGAGRGCGGDTGSGITVSAERPNDETGSEFSPETSTFFLGEAFRANANTFQLNSAIDRIELLEKFCGK